MGRQRSPAVKHPIAPLFSPSEWQEVVRVLHLSPRQADVVELILRGKRDKQIAADLGLRVSTVRMHLRHIFARLDVADRLGLALRAFATFRQSDAHRRYSRK